MTVFSNLDTSSTKRLESSFEVFEIRSPQDSTPVGSVLIGGQVHPHDSSANVRQSDLRYGNHLSVRNEVFPANPNALQPQLGSANLKGHEYEIHEDESAVEENH